METPTAPAPDSDPRGSLKHLLAEDVDSASPSQTQDASTPVKAADTGASQAAEAATPGGDDGNDETPLKAEGGDNTLGYTATTTTSRRNANGSVSSVYSGNKIRHLKKEDGIPLWRKDIQYDFLKLVFEDDKKVFHKMSDGTSGHSFADIYLDAMAKSSKCSKILKDKLLTERPAAINMAMVCLLVNVGRMNTTLNFFPEMRAQLRTYHSIPSLQAHQDPNAYKQLQDAPRLKSILKGATEDTEQPSTIEDIRKQPIPRTNPVNLIFVLAQYAPKISEIHFFPPRDFFDLVMRSSLSSRSRATAFLWLMWWYLESSFTEQDALNNPFGKGTRGEDDDADSVPVKCPQFQYLTPEEAALENVDTEEEKEFGAQKQEERKAILASDMAPVVTGPKRSAKKGFNNNPVFSVNDADGPLTPGRDYNSPMPQGRSGSRLKRHVLQADYASDTDGTRTASPPRNMDINNVLNDETPSVSSAPAVKKGPGRGNWGPKNRGDGTPSSRFKAKAEQAADGTPGISFPAGPHGFYIPLNGEPPVHKRHRPQTQHQIAVEQYRRSRVECILDSRLRSHYKVAKKHRMRDGAMARAWLRCKMMMDGYDTDEDIMYRDPRGADEVRQTSIAQLAIPSDPERYPPGFVGILPMPMEPPDYGEEAHARLQVMRRISRRISRWEEGTQPPRENKDKRGHWREGRGPPQDLDDDKTPRLLSSARATSASGRSGRRGGRRSNNVKLTQEYTLAEDRDEMEGVIEEEGEDEDMDGDATVLEDGDTTMMVVDDGDGDNAGEEDELDDADREMLGEVDAEESDDD